MASEPIEQRKSLGAFYTEGALVDFLVRWGVTEAGAQVLDPSCGDGRFLAAAAAHGAALVIGCDLDPAAVAASAAALSGTAHELVAGDFFTVDPALRPPVDVVLGNPPFIRYQRFTGEARQRALAAAERCGVRLTGLTSSWAPFLLHASRFLRPAGRMAMVVPAEIAQTQYGLVTLRALAARFGITRLVTFETNLFADAQTETFLFLGERHGESARSVEIIPLRTAADLAGWEAVAPVVLPLCELEPLPLAEAYLLPDERTTWRDCAARPGLLRLGDLGTLTNGYVTGDNRFFHRRQRDAAATGLPTTWLRAAARSAKSLSGLWLTTDDITRLDDGAAAHHLLVPDHADQEALVRLTAEAQTLGVVERYKCRTRKPWWRVPGLNQADLLVSYMVGDHPRASVNQAGALFTNALHGVRLYNRALALKAALGLHSSLSQLSLEIEGRTYGGGILKLEPTEMERVRLPWPELEAGALEPLSEQVDRLLRQGHWDEATGLVDEMLLVRGLAWNEADVTRLRQARERLRRRRGERTKGGSDGPA